MKITIIVEGKTEVAFKPFLVDFLREHLADRMPRINTHCFDGRIPTGDKLRRVVERRLNATNEASDHVIALTDIYTGSTPRQFADAADAKQKMRE